MTEQEIFKAFIEILEEYVQIDPEELQNANRDTDILKGLKINSARFVDIIIKAEDKFDIEIDDDDADSISTIGDAVDIVSRKIGVIGKVA